MKKNHFSLFIAAVFIAVMLSSCSATYPVAASSNPVGTKVGKSTGHSFFTVLVFGSDASIQTAAKNGGITKISTVDFTREDILGIYQTYTTTVTGE
jgi:ABC-type sugar transport system substrate-binding protein